MRIMYKHSPKRENAWAPVLTTLSLVLFVLCLALSPLSSKMGYPSLVPMSLLGLCAVFFVTFAFLTVRYILTSYLYVISPDLQNEDELLLSVEQICGKRRMTVARVALSDIERVEIYKRGRIPKGASVFRYCVDIAPRAYAFYIKEDLAENERATVMVIMADRGILDIVCQYASVEEEKQDKKGRK